jgi:hypothetical protein
MSGAASCLSGGIEKLTLQADGSLAFMYEFTPAQGDKIASSGTLKRP